MRFLVTGATGFIGGAVARQLLVAGHSVRVIVRSPERAADLSALGVTLHKGDITDKASLSRPMSGVDGVFHIAGWYKVGRSDASAARAINIDGTRNVLETMREVGVPKGVYTSTLAVNSDTHGQVVDETYRFTGTHISLYDGTKAAAHAIAQAFIEQGLPLVIVQPGLVYGPGDTSSVRTTLVEFLERRLPLLPTQTAFSWGHIDDIAYGHLAAMERGTAGRAYFLAGPVHTLVDAIATAQEITGIPGPRLRASPGVLRTVAALSRVVGKIIPLPPEYSAEGLRVLAGTTYVGSSARARAELGWIARPLREGLESTLRHEMARLRMFPLARR